MKDKFSVDFNNLAQTLAPKPTTYKLNDVEHKIEKVAYDLVRFRDNQDTDQLWKIQDAPDGPVIVALYGDDGSLAVDGEKTASKKSDWDVLPDKKAMQIFYKGEPLAILSEKDIGIPCEEFSVVRRWLPEKLASNETLQKAVLNVIPVAGRKLISKRFPELAKVAEVSSSEEACEDTNNAETFPGVPSSNNLPDMFDSIRLPENVEQVAAGLKAKMSPQELQKVVDILQGKTGNSL